jgi:hypothetical protein
MERLALHLVLLLVVGCSTGITVHDESRAAELIVDFLTALKSDKGIRLSYDWTDKRFKKEVSFDEFSQMVAFIRSNNEGVDIRVTGYETFGAREVMTVYANSDIGNGKMFLKFVLAGTKFRDYYLLSLDIDDSKFEKKGIYRNYAQSIVVRGV